MSNEKFVENFYHGIYLTETILGNPNGDFVDNSPRNFDGMVFTTDKCIKYNVRKCIHENFEKLDEDIEKIENFVFFFPRLVKNADLSEPKFKSRDTVYKDFFDNKFDKLLEKSIDVRMFGGTFSFRNNSRQIYGPIQISYGVDINDAKIERIQISAPFATNDGSQTSNGFEYVVDDAIISYDITINPNNFPNLLLQSDLDLFKKSLWFGTNSKKSSSKKTDSLFLMFIKIKNEVSINSLNIGELNKLISIKNKRERKLNDNLIKLDCSLLFKKLNKFKERIENIEVIFDEDKVSIEGVEGFEIKVIEPQDLIKEKS